MNKVPRWVFSYVGNKAYDFSSKKKGFCAQKRPNLAQNWHFWSIWARPCRLIQCPVGGSVGGCGARAVSRKTPIYFMYTLLCIHNLVCGIEQNIHECVFIVPSPDTFSNPFFFSRQCTAPCNYSTLQAHQPFSCQRDFRRGQVRRYNFPL